MITLQWKSFQVNLSRAHKYFKDNLVRYDGMVSSNTDLLIFFTETELQSDIDVVNTYWDSLTELSESTPNSDEISANVSMIVRNACNFGAELANKFATENVLMGITSANKTLPVSDYLQKLSYYLTTGSLYGAVSKIDELISLGIPPELSPFVTEARLLEYRAAIMDYLV